MSDETTGTAELPPSLKEEFSTLKTDTPPGSLEPGGDAPKKRGRKPGSKNKPKEPVAETIVKFPVEALALMHFEIWRFIAKRMRSEYKISEDGAKEMGNYASLVIAQYLGPYLAQHQALAAYLLTQVTALSIVVVTREPKPKKEIANEPITAIPFSGE